MAEHSGLGGVELHDSKGLSTATSGSVFVCDGAGSGSWVVLAGTTATSPSSSSSQEFAAVAGHNDFIISFSELYCSSSSAYIEMQFENGSGWIDSTNYYQYNHYTADTATVHYNDDGFRLYDSGATYYSGVYRVSNFGTSLPTMIVGQGYEIINHSLVGVCNTDEAYTSMRLRASTGLMTGAINLTIMS